MVGVKLPVLETSGGRAYLAFSSDQQREETLSGIEAKFGLKRPFILKDGPLEHILEKTCQRGIGFRVEDYIGTTMSMSAPIFHQDRVISCLTIILTSSALKFDKAVELYRDKLLATTRKISAEFEQQYISEE